MALSPNINDREKDKFVEVAGQTAVAVSLVSGSMGSEETIQENGTVSGTPVDIPTVAAGDLTQVLVRCLTGPIAVSFDGGTTYLTVKTDEVLTFEPHGISQIKIDGTGTFETAMNRSV